MSILTFEGIVEGGQIRLKESVRLSEKTKVYIVIPNFETKQAHQIISPRLVQKDQARDFKMEIVGEL